MTEPEPPSPSGRQQFLGSAAWTALSRILISLLGVVITGVLARLLQPSDFGLLAMALVFSGLVQQFQDFGAGTALVQLRNPSRENQQVTFTLALIASVLFYTILYFLAGPIARFYEEPDVVGVLRWIGLTFPLSAFITVPRSMLRRELRLRGESLVSSLAIVMEGILAITLAWTGFGVWALVAGRLMSVAVTAIGLAYVYPWSPGLRFRSGEGGSILRFGSGITLSSFLWYIYSNVDFLLIGRILGSTSLGLYRMAWNLAKMPWQRLWGAVNPLVLPYFLRHRDDPEGLRRSFCQMTRYLAILTFPAIAGLAAVSGDAVPTILGEGWDGAIVPLRWLCVFGVARAALALFAPLLISVERLRLTVWFNVLCVLVMPAAFYWTLDRGPSGPAMVWAVAYPLLSLIFLVPAAVRVTGLRLAEYLKIFLGPGLAMAAMVAVVLALGQVLPLAPPIRMAVRVVVGAAVYIAVLRLMEGPVYGEIRSILADIRRGM